MNVAIEKTLNNKLVEVFKKLNMNQKFAIMKNSDRPDLSDFQCNAALALSKEEKKNPRDIANIIVEELSKDKDFKTISIDGPGFINITISEDFLQINLEKMAEDQIRFGIEKTPTPKKVVLDFGGPNVAKSMHVGHLRSAVIGESVQRVERFIGNEVVSDVHFGDWGTPMGMIISEMKITNPELSYFEDGKEDNFPTNFSYSIEDITEIYKNATIRCKEDEKARETARLVTADLQDGHKGYYALWQHLRRISVNAVKVNYDELDVSFDLWWGESDAHQDCYKIIEIAKEKEISEVDDGATIIRLEESNKPKPPVILVKRDGGFTYHTTDIATVNMRVEQLKADEIIYFTDKRQAFHFEQVFEASEKLGIAPNVEFKHIGFGTVNGSDGKPFKTRDGGVMSLEGLISLSKEKVSESMPKANEIEGYDEEYINNLINEVAIGAIKFQDFKNNIASGYVFEVDDFAKFEGKTGPYIQYAIARINSILKRANDAGISEKEIKITNKEERDLALRITQLNSTVWKAYEDKEPSIISEFAYILSQNFSSFYSTSSIINEEDKNIAGSRLKLAKLARDILILLLNLLGIKAPEVMLKAE